MLKFMESLSDMKLEGGDSSETKRLI
jgi:hypothetical protein